MVEAIDYPQKEVEEKIEEKGEHTSSPLARIKENPKSLLLFSPENRVRRFCKTVINHPAFDNFILLCIILNSVMLAIVDYRYVDEEGNPSTKGSSRNQVVEAMEPFFTWTFVTEMTLKVIAQGFLLQKDSYLSQGWNRLDFIIVITRYVYPSFHAFFALFFALLPLFEATV